MKLKHSPHAHIMSFLFLFFIFSNGVSGNTVTVVNDCDFNVWPGIFSDNQDINNTTGFKLTKGTSRSFQLWGSGTDQVNIWGRTGCTFDGSRGGSCATGDCGSGELECNGRTYTPPVTVAEFSYFYNSYDVSIMNGYNLPMTIEPSQLTAGLPICRKMGCTVDLNQWCPSGLVFEGGGGCKSGCQVDPSQITCCETSKQETCNPTSMGQLFHLACPKSVTYQYNSDDNIVNDCVGSDYTVRFCPPANTFSTIKLGDQIFVNDPLVSVNGTFTLGFFGANYSYLGIWYTNDLQSRKVWVANPNKPFVSTGRVAYLDSPFVSTPSWVANRNALSIDSNTGNLIIIDENNRILMTISTNVDAGPNPNVTATLEDNGNFRLINEIDKTVLWQSFDHPTNVLLPGMKLGYDITTGQNWTLISWLTDEIPAAGAFTLTWEPINETYQSLMIRREASPTGLVEI